MLWCHNVSRTHHLFKPLNAFSNTDPDVKAPAVCSYRQGAHWQSFASIRQHLFFSSSCSFVKHSSKVKSSLHLIHEMHFLSHTAQHCTTFRVPLSCSNNNASAETVTSCCNLQCLIHQHTHTHRHTLLNQLLYRHTNISRDRILYRDRAVGMEEEELTSCCCRDTRRTGGFISAHGSMRFHLESTKQSVGDSSSHFHEDNLEVSADHHQRNAAVLRAFQKRLCPSANEEGCEFNTLPETKDRHLFRNMVK